MKALIAALFVATACASPLIPPASPTTEPSSAAAPIAVRLVDFKIEPSTLTAGTDVLLDVTSDGPTPHNLTIRDARDVIVLQSADLSAGDSDTIAGQLEPATYTIFCAFPGHESLGMRGTLTVAE